jgi:integrase
MRQAEVRTRIARHRLERSNRRSAATLKDTENGLVAGETKNRQRRSIRLSKTTMDALTSHRKRQSRAGIIQPLVFPDKSGGYLRRQNFNRRNLATILATAERESGLSFDGHTFHDTRHTCVTLLLQEGEWITRVSQRLGHSTVKTTLDYYANCVPQDEDRPAARFDLRRTFAIGSRIGSSTRKAATR